MEGESCVALKTALLPTKRQSRLVRIQNDNTDLKVGFCLEPHDLAASKLAAGREKDWPFVAEMIKCGIVIPALLQQRIQELPVSDALKERLAIWVKTLRV